MGRFVRRTSSPLVIMAFFAAIACVGVGAGGVASALRKPPTSPVIATVDLEAVYDGLEKRKAKEIEFKQKETEFKTKLDALQAKIEGDKKNFELMPEGPQKKARGQELIRSTFQFDFDRQYAEKFLDQMTGEMLRELYEEITLTSKELAVKNGYSMVIADDSRARIRGSGRDEVNRLIALKRNLYVEPAHDVTQELIAMMNNQFAANAGK